MDIEHFTDFEPPTSSGTFLSKENDLSIQISDAVKEFNIFHKVTPNTIVLHPNLAMRVRSSLKEAKVILQLMCEASLDDNENYFALVKFPSDDGGGEDIDKLVFVNIFKRAA